MRRVLCEMRGIFVHGFGLHTFRLSYMTTDEGHWSFLDLPVPSADWIESSSLSIGLFFLIFNPMLLSPKLLQPWRL